MPPDTPDGAAIELPRLPTFAPDPSDIPPPASETAPEPAPVKRKRGRPSGAARRKAAAEAAAAPPTPPDPEEVAALASALALGFGVAFDLVAARRGAHWSLTDRERGMMGSAWADALAPYLGNLAGYTPWAMAAIATVAVVGPRIAQEAIGGPGTPSGAVEPPRNGDGAAGGRGVGPEADPKNSSAPTAVEVGTIVSPPGVVTGSPIPIDPPGKGPRRRP